MPTVEAQIVPGTTRVARVAGSVEQSRRLDQAEAGRTGRPGIIRYTRNPKGATKTTWYQVEPLPE